MLIWVRVIRNKREVDKFKLNPEELMHFCHEGDVFTTVENGIHTKYQVIDEPRMLVKRVPYEADK